MFLYTNKAKLCHPYSINPYYPHISQETSHKQLTTQDDRSRQSARPNFSQQRRYVQTTNGGGWRPHCYPITASRLIIRREFKLGPGRAVADPALINR